MPITKLTNKPKLTTSGLQCKNVHENDYRKVNENQILKSKPKALQHFKVDPVLKIDEPIYKQA